MPYLKKDQRPALDELITPLIEYLKSLPVEEQDRALGVLTAVTHELYRKIVAPYEETKIKENEDVD